MYLHVHVPVFTSDTNEGSPSPADARENGEDNHSAGVSDEVENTEQVVELSLTNPIPPHTKRTISGDTTNSVTSDSAGLLPA